jgi:hypothetical protein
VRSKRPRVEIDDCEGCLYNLELCSGIDRELCSLACERDRVNVSSEKALIYRIHQ